MLERLNDKNENTEEIKKDEDLTEEEKEEKLQEEEEQTSGGKNTEVEVDVGLIVDEDKLEEEGVELPKDEEGNEYIEVEIERNKDGIKYYQDLQQYIKTTSASLDEIMERYHEYQEMIDYHKEELEDLIKTSHWVYFLKQIHNEQQMLEKDWPGTLWIYAGIEGSNPYPDKEAK